MTHKLGAVHVSVLLINPSYVRQKTYENPKNKLWDAAVLCKAAPAVSQLQLQPEHLRDEKHSCLLRRKLLPASKEYSAS